MTWEMLAACAGMDTEMFFGEQEKARLARKICRGCPVRPECLAHAIGFPEDYGIFGGMTPQERNDYIRDTGTT